MKHVGQFVGQKEIEILGRKFFVSKDAKYWAVDPDGEVQAYNSKPLLGGEDWGACIGGTLICYVDLEDTDWKTTLTEIK